MLSFKRPSSQNRGGGHRLPMPFKSLAKLGVAIRRSELSMIAGVPGAGKSALALNLALKMGVPTLYVAADTSEWTMRIRTLACLHGIPQAVVEERLLKGEELDFSGADHIAWCFDAEPTVSSIRVELEAFAEVHGVYPELIIVDNLIDIAQGSGDEWQMLRATMKELKVLARETDSAVVVLHHISEDNKIQFTLAPPRWAIQGKVNQLPALILTLGALVTGSIGVGIVKNRGDQANPNGAFGVTLDFDGSLMQITDKRHRF